MSSPRRGGWCVEDGRELRVRYAYTHSTGNSQVIIMMKNANFFVFQLFASRVNCVWFPCTRNFVRLPMRNPSTGVLPNLPIIDRRNSRIDRSGCRNRSVESSDNRQVISGNRQIASAVDRPSSPRNHQLHRLESINNPSPKRRTLSPRRQGLSKRSGLLFLPGNRTNEPLPSMLWAPSGSRKKRRI